MQSKNKYAQRPVIYQMLPRIFANINDACVPSGQICQNGSGKLNDITPDVLQSIRGLGCTHVWYTGIIEHAHDADYTAYGIPRHNPHVIKGRAGSPYAITDYYDIDPDVAVDVPNRMREFEDLVRRTHKSGLKVITDFVPNHVARQYHSDAAPKGVNDFGSADDRDMFFRPSNNYFYLPRQQFSPSVYLGNGSDAYIEFPARATGNDCYSAFPGVNDWYETVKLNYGVDPWNGSKHFEPVPDTWLRMLHILRFWASKGIDGMRCDMVHMVPVEFWAWAIPQVKRDYPEVIFIAEIYDVALYDAYIRAGFDYLYDKVTLYDTLRAIDTANTSAAQLTSCWQTVEGMSRHMLNFIENHDEQRYASAQFAGRADTVLPLLVVTATIGLGAVMIYMAQELGEDAPDAEGFSGADGRTTIFDYWSLERLRRWLGNDFEPADDRLTESEKHLRQQYAEVLKLVNGCPAVNHGRFFDLTYANYDNPQFNPHRNFAYLRSTDTETLLIVVNFDDQPAQIAVNIPAHAFNTLQIAQTDKPRQCTDLLTGKRHKTTFNAQQPATMTVAAHGAAVLKFKNPVAKAAHKP